MYQQKLFQFSYAISVMSAKREEARKAILHSYMQNTAKSFSLIAKETNASRWTVKRTNEKFIKEKTLVDRPRSGRPKSANWPKLVEKFGRKVLVWQAICQCGQRSRPFFHEGTINTEIYVDQCLKKRLLPFLKSHSKSTIFWPDLATSHYASATLQWYRKNNVRFVEKDFNPPNSPELRPIEKYWALVKAVLRKEGRTAKSLSDFSLLWRSRSKKI